MRNMPWYTYVVLAVIILGLAFFLYFKPQQAELNRIKAERQTVEKEVQELLEKKKQLDVIEAELATLTQTLKELEVIIPLRKEVDVILRRVQQMAFDSRLELVRFIPRGEINREFYSEWPIAMDIRGNYHNLASFFDRLSKFARIFNIENFTVKALNNQTDDLTISSAFTAKTYIFLEEGETAPAAKPQPKRRTP
ncbi:MAG: type 4a pilus biogenesis protein PilO [Candidatus Aminicenantes bacterium]|nr:type 4a pilus biogenesis protein PilO [Candidatus Aminicenantes bacterium]